MVPSASPRSNVDRGHSSKHTLQVVTMPKTLVNRRQSKDGRSSPSPSNSMAGKHRLIENRHVHGKSLRRHTPRSSHADWKSPEDRPDPIAILIESSARRVQHLVPIRYGRMLQSPFAFYRGAAAIMASDL